MFRTLAILATAALLTTGTVAAMAADPSPAPAYKVTINKAGKYCVHTPPVTGSLISGTECRTVQAWAKDGVTFEQH